MNSYHNKVLAAIFSIIVLVLFLCAYMVMHLTGLHIWSLLLVILAVVIVVSINWQVLSGQRKRSDSF